MESQVHGVGHIKSAAVRVTYGTPRQRSTPPAKRPVVDTPESSRKRPAPPTLFTSVSSSDSDASSSETTTQRRAKRPLVQTSLPTTLITPSRPLPTLSKRPTAAPVAAKREQTFLDFGQRPNAPEPCPQCGMAYQRGRQEDEQMHTRFHRAWLRSQRNLLTWNADLGAPDAQGVHMVDLQTASRRELQRALDLINYVNAQLGAVVLSAEDLAMRQRKLFVHVGARDTVDGCVLAEAIEGARRLESTPGAAMCAGEVVPAACGISRIWVAPGARRSGVASRLMDAVCAHFVYGCRLSLDKLAFTQPTADGRAFAARLFGREDFLVYAEE
ncbi:hypothetical protein GGI05_005391 [Coemansia sp. RSA 2603]|nr:hypothetical protein GGI05_005391 [Coemansia sp. RSA 2603]